MAGIPSEFIDQLLDRVDIIDVISPRITLKKAGKDHQALCPFHTENSPSFTVSQNKQFYHCFGCGKHGSAIGFLMEFEGMEFVDCVESLAQSVGMAVPKSNFSNTSAKSNNLYEVVEKANRYFNTQFNQSQFARDYIQERGIDQETAKIFQIGYAPDSWDGLMKQFQNQQTPELLKAGLLVEKDNSRTYDKFRGRVIFPIQDRRSRVIAFGGRAVLADQKPKYLNSPETPLFHKGKELYGLNIAKKFSSEKSIIVVEGYMDVIALHQAGVKNSVATLGTATSQYHVTTLLRSYNQIIFCFDGDNAGRQAAWKALEIALPIYRDDKIIKFLFLPDGQDPDTYVQEFGEGGFKHEVEKAQSLSDFLLSKLKADINLDSLDGRALFIDNSKTYITKLPNGQFRSLLLEEIERIASTKVNMGKQPEASRVKDIDQWTPVRKAITLLINQPSLVKNIPDSFDFDSINQNGIKILTQIVDFCRLNPHISTAVLIENFKQHSAYNHISTLATVELDLNDSQMGLELEDLINYFNKISNQNRIQSLRTKLASQGLTKAEKEQLMSLLTNQIG